MKERIYYLDALRIFAIFFVILLHVAALNLDTEPVYSFNWNVFSIYDILARFCVPVMVMISGSLFLDPTRIITIKSLYTKRIFRVVTAYLFWSVIYALYVLLENRQPMSASVIITFAKNVLAGYTHMWFCYMIVGLYIITPFIRKIVENEILLKYFLIISFVSTILIPSLQLIPALSLSTVLTSKLNLFLGLGYSFYFVVGYYISKTDISKKIAGLIYALGIVSILFAILMTSYLSIRTNTPVRIFYEYLSINISLQSLAVFVFFKNNFAKIITNHSVLKIITRISPLTFGMYLIHFLFINAFTAIGLTPTSFNPIIAVPVISVLTFVLSLLASALIEKIPVLKKYIM
ncbi:MAG: acyltransferase family protein [Mobilitalea sp.]